MSQVCNDHRCFGNVNGVCNVLNGPDYEKGKCPFFKTSEQLEDEQKSCKLRLKLKYGK